MSIPPGELTGTILKVQAANAETGVIHCWTQEGATTEFAINAGGNVPEVGQIILLGRHEWRVVPADLWHPRINVGVVKKIIDPQTLLVDNGANIETVKNDVKEVLSENCTIQYNYFEGFLRKVSDEPIRSRDGDLDYININDYKIDTTKSTLKFSDFGGHPAVVKRARELIETQLDRSELLAEIGARPVKGVLFTGPPGTGKTYLAKIIACQADADFYLISGPTIMSKWVGETELTLRRIFNDAANSKSGRAIIFMDEIDSIAERRSDNSHEASKKIVAQLLTLMDGFETHENSVVVIAATNRVDSLDPAVTRPGRFDWEIEFALPSLRDRIEILRVGSADTKCADDLPLIDIALKTEKWSSAELSSIWTEAALIAAADSRRKIAGEDFAQGYERVAKRPKRTKVIESE